MEDLKRLVLVPEHMACTVGQKKPLVHPFTAEVSHLDSEMKNLLKRQEIDPRGESQSV